jgi:hypothetical protein
MKLLWNNSTSNDMQLSREKTDDIMWKIGLYITYGEVKIQDSCFKTPDYYPHELSTIILRAKKVHLSLSIIMKLPLEKII